jgi:hypothetical protein
MQMVLKCVKHVIISLQQLNEYMEKKHLSIKHMRYLYFRSRTKFE